MSNLSTWLTDIADAIREKEGTLDPINHWTYPNRIRNLPTEPRVVPPPWEPPSDWPNIEEIVDNDVQDGYPYKYIYLFKDDYSYINLTGGIAYKTSDNVFYTANVEHIWDKAQDVPCADGYKTRWLIVYTESKKVAVKLPYETVWADSGTCEFGKNGFSGNRVLKCVTGEFQSIKNANDMFRDCSSLTRVPDILDLSACTSTY